MIPNLEKRPRKFQLKKRKIQSIEEAKQIFSSANICSYELYQNEATRMDISPSGMIFFGGEFASLGKITPGSGEDMVVLNEDTNQGKLLLS